MLGGVDEALGHRQEGGGRRGGGHRRGRDQGRRARRNAAEQRRAGPRQPLRRADHRRHVAEGGDRLGHRAARRAGADPRLRDAARRHRLRHRTARPAREPLSRADRAGRRRAGDGGPALPRRRARTRAHRAARARPGDPEPRARERGWVRACQPGGDHRAGHRRPRQCRDPPDGRGRASRKGFAPTTPSSPTGWRGIGADPRYRG